VIARIAGLSLFLFSFGKFLINRYRKYNNKTAEVKLILPRTNEILALAYGNIAFDRIQQNAKTVARKK